MTESVGKMFIYLGSHSKCVVCDVIFSRAKCRVHAAESCFPVPPACPPIPYGVMEGQA